MVNKRRGSGELERRLVRPSEAGCTGAIKKKIVSCKIIGLKNLMREGGKSFFISYFFSSVSAKDGVVKKKIMGMN